MLLEKKRKENVGVALGLHYLLQSSKDYSLKQKHTVIEFHIEP